MIVNKDKKPIDGITQLKKLNLKEVSEKTHISLKILNYISAHSHLFGNTDDSSRRHIICNGQGLVRISKGHHLLLTSRVSWKSSNGKGAVSTESLGC